MTAVPIAVRSNKGRYDFIGVTTLVNCYAESQGEDAKAVLAVLPCDGMTEFAAVTDTPCRGMIYAADLDCIYSVHSSSVWKVLRDGTSTRIGVIPGVNPVQIARNQATVPQFLIRCDAGIFKIEADAVEIVIDETFYDDAGAFDVASVSYIGGYFVYGRSKGQFFYSPLNAVGPVDGLAFATAEQSADRLTRIYADRGELFLMGQTTIEPWRVTGATDSPIEPLQGAVISKGILAAHSVAALDNSLFWVSDDGQVSRLGGSGSAYLPERVSSHEVERSIRGDEAPEDIEAMTWSIGGHAFYVITGAGWSYGYDAATKAWHKRESYGLPRWRARFAVQAWGRIIVGDRLGGSLFSLDATAADEDGAVMVRGLDTPTMHTFPNGGIVDALHIDIATGYGDGSDVEPVLMLSWSNDGGSTWRGNRHLSAGKAGARKRIATRRLGRFGAKGRVWRLRMSDACPFSIIGIDAQVRPLKL